MGYQRKYFPKWPYTFWINLPNQFLTGESKIIKLNKFDAFQHFQTQ